MPDSAKVIKLKIFRDWSNRHRIKNAMRVMHGSVVMKHGVATRISASHPQPAWPKVWTMGRDWAVFIDLGPDAILKMHERMAS